MTDRTFRILDLFSGAGGVARGYADAGFEVVGVDIEPQPHYPYEFHQADALTYPLDGFDAIHASPPCQAYSVGRNMWHGRLPEDRHPDLVGPTRDRLVGAGVPYVIENVEGAPLTNYIVLCGDMFGLGVKRHRLFETSWFIWNPPVCRKSHPDFKVSVFGGGALSRTPPGGTTVHGTGNFMQRRTHVGHELAAKAMGIEWMTRDELAQAIPPPYTEFIGRQLVAYLEDPSLLPDRLPPPVRSPSPEPAPRPEPSPSPDRFSDRSLFPDVLPDRPPKAPKHTGETCCTYLSAPADVELRTWRLLHQVGHRRSTISADALAVLADTSRTGALRALAAAVTEGWVIPARLERPSGPALWVGVLSKRK